MSPSARVLSFCVCMASLTAQARSSPWQLVMVTWPTRSPIPWLLVMYFTRPAKLLFLAEVIGMRLLIIAPPF
ncbi:hypothetical protein D9M71_817150 [compost metagenome]